MPKKKKKATKKTIKKKGKATKKKKVKALEPADVAIELDSKGRPVENSSDDTLVFFLRIFLGRAVYKSFLK